MKRISFIILFVILSQLLVARKDSTRLTNFRGFYLNTYYPYKMYGYYADYGKYSDEYHYIFDSKGYQYQTPGIGVGYIINHREFFIKTDFNYWYGSKQLNDNFSFSSQDKNAADPYDSFTAYPIYYPPVGSQYYKIKDHYAGNINFHYFDIGFAITGNITRFLRIYSGWRLNHMIKSKWAANVKREASLYEVKRYNSQYDRVDSLIGVENIEYKGDEAASKSTQRFNGNILYNLGINANFRIKGKLFFVDLLYETTYSQLATTYGSQSNCVTFKLAYVFNYSTYFGKKKTDK